jgi:protein-S-isoprenylcysteine O-methyltransferase Ste14
VSQIVPGLASHHRWAHNAGVSGPALADACLAIAWLVVVGDLLRAARRAGVAGGRRIGAAALLVVVTGAAAFLESTTGGRLVWRPGLAVGGVVLAWLGVGLHAWGRRALGTNWTSTVTPPARGALAETGPYAFVRHPLYAAILLLGAGTVAAHPSRATLAAMLGVAIGVALKRRAEDRALAARFGEPWRAYARRVPPLCPRLRRGTRR